jgi:hypothetical protein
MRTALSISTCLVLLAALPAAGQRPARTRVVGPSLEKPTAGKRLRASDVIGSQVTFRDGAAKGKVIDLEMNDRGGIKSVIVRSNDELVSVPWSEVRFEEPAPPSRDLRTVPGPRLRGATIERETVVEEPAPVDREVIVSPRRGALEPRSGDPYDDYLYARFGYRTTPGWRLADLLKDRFEARRAPPRSRPADLLKDRFEARRAPPLSP